MNTPQATTSRPPRRAMSTVVLGLFVAAGAAAQEPGLAAPPLVLRESVAGMPRSDTQEVRVLTATFRPGDKTVFHTHRSPVTVYVLEGQFTLELEGRAPVVVGPGQAYVEPPRVRMTGYNKSSTSPLKVVIFYVSEEGTPFLDRLNRGSSMTAAVAWRFAPRRRRLPAD